MEIPLKLHTVIVLVGPTNCGKTHFSKVLYKKIKELWNGLNVQHVSSDEIRRTLLDSDSDKYSARMLEISNQAFQMLKLQVDCVTQFPVNAEFVIVDTTGLNSEFRKDIEIIAKKNHYNLEYIIWDFKEMADYYKNGGQKDTIRHHVERLRKSVIGEIKGNKTFIRHHLASSKNTINVTIPLLEIYQNYHLDPNRRYFVIGDVHESIDELKLLIQKAGFTIGDDGVIQQNSPNSADIILIGDIVDKGNNTAETIEWCHKNLNMLKIVLGNHESTVRDLLKGVRTVSEYEPGLIDRFFTSYNVLKDNPDLQKKFFEICDHTVPFFKFLSTTQNTRSFYLTHAPCKKEFIGKLDKMSLKKQTYVYIPKLPSEAHQYFDTIFDDATFNYPYHVCGHVALTTHYVNSRHNQLLIDTGCSQGGKLTGVFLGAGISKAFFKSVNCIQKYEGTFGLLELRQSHTQSTESDDDIIERYNGLERMEKARIRHIIENRINYISGTICPADKMDNRLETVEAGLRYYFEKDPKMKLSIQTKYMGSRCNIYLDRDIAQCYAVSRNGHVIKHIDMAQMKLIYTGLLNRLANWMTDNAIQTVLLDGELMPWSALGKGLVDNSFKIIGTAVQSEIDILETAGFQDQYQQLLKKMADSGYEKDSHHMSSKDLNQKYGGNQYETFKTLLKERKEHIDLDHWQKYVNVFRQQLEYYAYDGPYEYKPFGILKVVFADGSERIPAVKDHWVEVGTVEAFATVSDDEQLVIDFQQESFESALTRAGEFFDRVTTQLHMEGIVIKPDIMSGDMAPFLKVRNEDYLTIIYGPDYRDPTKYNKLINSKGIWKKLELSIKEFKIGIRMLETPMNDIDKPQYMGLLMEFLNYENAEKAVDPRL